jgi:hypothetical protein
LEGSSNLNPVSFERDMTNFFVVTGVFMLAALFFGVPYLQAARRRRELARRGRMKSEDMDKHS